MKKVLFAGVLLYLTSALTITKAQNQLTPHFGLSYSDSFQTVNKDAMWLAQYDMAAWITSDSVQRYANDTSITNRLGEDWFCYTQNDEWNAIYGNNKTGSYDQVFHFVIKRDGEVYQSSEKVDTSMAQRYSRAITLAADNFSHKHKELQAYRFNKYIRSERNDTIQVWLLPAIQPNSGLAIYGIEENYIIDPSGKKIIKDLSYYQNEVNGYKPDRNSAILLLNLQKNEPTVGALFFVWNYKRLFKNIAIKNKSTFSFLRPQDGKLVWMQIPQNPAGQSNSNKKE